MHILTYGRYVKWFSRGGGGEKNIINSVGRKNHSIETKFEYDVPTIYTNLCIKFWERACTQARVIDYLLVCVFVRVRVRAHAPKKMGTSVHSRGISYTKGISIPSFLRPTKIIMFSTFFSFFFISPLNYIIKGP